jgi:hypothetical protein
MIGYIVGCQSFTGILREFFAPIRQKKITKTRVSRTDIALL